MRKIYVTENQFNKIVESSQKNIKNLNKIQIKITLNHIVNKDVIVIETYLEMVLNLQQELINQKKIIVVKGKINSIMIIMMKIMIINKINADIQSAFIIYCLLQYFSLKI